MSGSTLEIIGLRKSWGRLAVLQGIGLSVPGGQFVSLLGPSGCGKTTLLRLITGSLAPDAGRVLVDGADVTEMATHRRNMGMVFQNFALFPHLTVAENVAFPLHVRKIPAQAREAQVRDALAMVHLEALEARYPRELSGGQQQRVGLARAIVFRPTILLLDEPLSNLDAALREEMRIEISQVTRRLGITAVYVTHDQREALALSDSIALMNRGRIEQFGVPEDLYLRPANAFVARFIGYTNAVAVTVRPGSARIDGGEAVLHGIDDRGILGPGIAFFHPGDIALAPPPKANAVAHDDAIVARVEELAFMGDHFEYVVEDASGRRFKANVPIGGTVFERGSEVSVVLPAGKAVLVPRGAEDAETP